MDKNRPLAELPIDTALKQLLVIKRREIDSQCQRFLSIGDPESLHDLRVAMRRLLSIFIGFSPVFRPEHNIAEAMRALFGSTNHARDLEAMLSLLENFLPGLNSLRQQWQSELDGEYLHLHATLPQAWQELSYRFDTPNDLLLEVVPPQTLGRYAATQVKKDEKRLLKQIRQLCRTWDDGQAHKLRIHGKRIRYLLEPFADRQIEAAKAVRHLKRFQDGLGDYHDLAVLRKRLRRLRRVEVPDRDITLTEAGRALKELMRRQRQVIRRDYRGKTGHRLGKALRAARRRLAQE